MPTPQLDVYLPDGNVMNFPLTDERVVVGTSAKCTVMIDRPEVAAEHLLLSPRPDGCWVAVARGVTTPTLVDGQPFDRGMVAWGHSIVVGQVRMVLSDGTRAKSTAKGDKSGPKEEKVSPVILIAAAVIIPVALYMMFQAPTSSTPQRVRTPPPALFDTTARACNETDPTRARTAAEENGRVALAKAERMPFYRQDGIEAVGFYLVAAACSRVAGDAPAADAATRQSAALAARLEDEYRAHQFRLDRALEQHRTEDALFETRMLMAFVRHRRGDYLNALHVLERQLTLQIDQAAAARR